MTEYYENEITSKKSNKYHSCDQKILYYDEENYIIALVKSTSNKAN